MAVHVPEDAADQALHAAHLVPVDATKADVDQAREWERKSRGFDARSYEVLLVEYADTEPGW